VQHNWCYTCALTVPWIRLNWGWGLGLLSIMGLLGFSVVIILGLVYYEKHEKTKRLSAAETCLYHFRRRRNSNCNTEIKKVSGFKLLGYK
jgi:hypothetical protein